MYNHRNMHHIHPNTHPIPHNSHHDIHTYAYPSFIFPPSCPDPAMQCMLIGDMRKAWEQHVYWTRMLIISIAARLNDESEVTARLLQNPRDIADIFAVFFGMDAGKTIEDLLTEHLQIGAALITALRDRSKEADSLKTRWYANADRMADAFAALSPFYDREELKNMLYEHLDLTTKEALLRLSGNYAADIQVFDRVENEAIMMADYFSGGILQQFPERFMS